MEKGKIVWGLAVVNHIFLNFCMMVCVFHVSGKQYVPEEGDGTERLYRIDYGATFQGVTTALFGFFLAFCHFKVGKEPSAEKYTMLSAASAVMMLVFLQTAIIWGNEVTKQVEVTAHGYDAQECSMNDYLGVASKITDGKYTDGMCIPACSCTRNDDGNCNADSTMSIDAMASEYGPGFSGFQRFYKPTLALKPGTEAACTFAVFMFLVEMAKFSFMYLNKEELAAADYTMGTGTSEAQQVSGDGYQKL